MTDSILILSRHSVSVVQSTADTMCPEESELMEYPYRITIRKINHYKSCNLQIDVHKILIKLFPCFFLVQRNKNKIFGAIRSELF